MLRLCSAVWLLLLLLAGCIPLPDGHHIQRKRRGPSRRAAADADAGLPGAVAESWRGEGKPVAGRTGWLTGRPTTTGRRAASTARPRTRKCCVRRGLRTFVRVHLAVVVVVVLCVHLF